MSTDYEVQRSYDRIADEYARRMFEELRNKPMDREVLDMFASKVQGTVCDVGCGPGQAGRYLYDKGMQVMGVDLSPAMLKEARRLTPGMSFVQGSMARLPAADQEWGGIVGFYSLCHISRLKIPTVLAEFWRALRPDGWLLLAFHLGRGTLLKNQAWGRPVALPTIFLLADEIQRYLRESGFSNQGWLVRPPYGNSTCWETPNWRGYCLAQKLPERPQELTATAELASAVMTSSREAIEALLTGGADPNSKGSDGYAALHIAASDDRRDVVELLLQRGAQLDLPGPAGWTALHTVAYLGHLGIAQRLVEKGADPRRLDDVGNSPLHLACFTGQTQVGRWLLSLSVDCQAPNRQGETPLMLAKRAYCQPLSKSIELALQRNRKEGHEKQ